MQTRKKSKMNYEQKCQALCNIVKKWKHQDSVAFRDAILPLYIEIAMEILFAIEHEKEAIFLKHEVEETFEDFTVVF